MIIYIDDIIILNQNQQDLIKDRDTVIFTLQCLAFVINWEKSHLGPTQTLEYLGMLIAYVTMTLSLPERKLIAIIQKCQCLLAETVVTIREVSELVGILSYLLTNWLAYLYGRIQTPRPDVMPD